MADEKKEKEERLVEAEVLKHTSRQGQLMIAQTRHWLPLSVAKAMQKGGLVRPVPKAVPSHPVAPPPPPPTFADESDETEEDSDEGEDGE